MSFNEPWAQAENQDTVLDDTAWEHFFGTVEATKVCGSKKLPSQTASTQSNIAN